MTEKPKSPVRERMKRTGETYEVAFAAIRREQAARAEEAARRNEQRGSLMAPAADPMPNLKECLHLDDVLKALPADVPDSSKPTT